MVPVAQEDRPVGAEPEPVQYRLASQGRRLVGWVQKVRDAD